MSAQGLCHGGLCRHVFCQMIPLSIAAIILQKKKKWNFDEHILVSIYLAWSLQVADLAWTLSTMGFPDGSVVKKLPVNAGDTVWSLGQEDPLKKEMATRSSILAWEIPWIEEPGSQWLHTELDITKGLDNNCRLPWSLLSLCTCLGWRRMLAGPGWLWLRSLSSAAINRLPTRLV